MSARLIMVLSLAAATLLTLSACDSEDFGAVTSSQRNPAVERELFELARINGCRECHEVTVGKLGPSWLEISKRYEEAPRDAARERLIDSVKYGSNGQYLSWKTAEGMPPLGNRVSEEHIEQLVDYILDLRRS